MHVGGREAATKLRVRTAWFARDDHHWQANDSTVGTVYSSVIVNVTVSVSVSHSLLMMMMTMFVTRANDKPDP